MLPAEMYNVIMATSEDTAIEQALQTQMAANKLKDLGLKAESLAGLTILDLGSGSGSSLKTDLHQMGISAQVVSIDANPLPDTDIIRAKFSTLPVSDNSIDLLISRNAFPMYLPADSLELAVRIIGEIKRVLKPEGEARLTPWCLAAPQNGPRKIAPEPVEENEATEIFQAMRSVPGLTFQLVREGDVDPRSGEERTYYTEMMLIKKTIMQHQK